jgi:hypothetical protein
VENLNKNKKEKRMRVNSVEQLVPFISQVGFPIFVAVFMMTKVTSTLDGVKEAITDLTVVIEKMEERK